MIRNGNLDRGTPSVLLGVYETVDEAVAAHPTAMRLSEASDCHCCPSWADDGRVVIADMEHT